MTINILIFEDSETKMESFKDFLKLLLESELNSNLVTVIRPDDSMLDSDLMTTNFHAILIDDDLGNERWGNDIIDTIIFKTEEYPEAVNIPMIYYSAGTSIYDLRDKIKHHGNIQCETFDELAEKVFSKIKSKYF